MHYLIDIMEKVHKTYLHSAYISRIIRDHEDEDRCDLHSHE